MATKYIMMRYVERTKDQPRTVYVPVTFPRVLVHADMADYVNMVLRRANRNILEVECVSAGFVDFGTRNSDPFVHGRSESLELASRKEDIDIILNWDALNKDLPF